MMGRITFFTEWVKSTDDTFEVIEKLLIGYGNNFWWWNGRVLKKSHPV